MPYRNWIRQDEIFCVIALSELTTVIETLQELQRMHQLNLELLEQLDIVFKWIVETDMPIPNREKLSSLLHKTETLIKELYLPNATKYLQYRMLSDESKQPRKPDDKVTEPYFWFCFLFVCSEVLFLSVC